MLIACDYTIPDRRISRCLILLFAAEGLITLAMLLHVELELVKRKSS